MLTNKSLVTITIASIAVFITALDNLVVGVALPTIRTALGGSLESLEWTVNAYTMAFAVAMLPAAALGDRFGRRKVFLLGVAIFTAASAAAALSGSVDMLIAARAVQGLGAAAIMPLSLTLIANAVSADKRSAAIGVWGAISGLGVALGPAVGGAVVEGVSWEWIFWINVPVGLIMLPLGLRFIGESTGPDSAIDIRGVLLAAGGLFLLTFGIVRAPALGWGSVTVIACLAVSAILLAAFLAWERRAPAPMLPLRFFRSRAFSATNLLSFAMFFGVFGAIFLLSQFFQVVQGVGPLEAGARTLPWTAMPMIAAPIAAAVLYPRLGGRTVLTLGMALQTIGMAWLALVTTIDVPYLSLVPAFVLIGTGMAFVIAPSAEVILGSVSGQDAGKASGVVSTVREVGSVLGVAVLATVFQSQGSYRSPQAYTDGLTAALPIAVGALALGTIIAALLPPRPAASETTASEVAAAELAT